MNFTQKEFDELKIAYQKAVEEHKETFQFMNHEIDISYAKYLIEYLNQFLQ